MIRIGFLLNIPFEYKGGINYLRNKHFQLFSKIILNLFKF